VIIETLSTKNNKDSSNFKNKLSFSELNLETIDITFDLDGLEDICELATFIK